MLKIIIVEDEEFIRKGLVYTIDWLSMDCVVVADAENGEQGYQKIVEFKPDIVITDIKMPKMDGIEMVEKALQKISFKTIILTSYMEFEYAKKAIELRAFEYLVKPIDENKIKTTIEAIREEVSNQREIDFVLNNKALLEDGKKLLNDEAQDSYVDAMIKKITLHYKEKLSIESISEELGVSPSYLSRKFKDATEHTFLDYLNRYRIKQAIKLLQTERYRIAEVSELTGFSEYKHFCTVFKRYTNLSPTAFIKQTSK